MKNRNVALCAVILSMYPMTDLTIDSNETAGTTTISTPNNACTIVLDTPDWEFLTEELPNEAMNEGEETLQEAPNGMTSEG
jgi:hypothetical protein